MVSIVTCDMCKVGTLRRLRYYLKAYVVIVTCLIVEGRDFKENKGVLSHPLMRILESTRKGRDFKENKVSTYT